MTPQMPELAPVLKAVEIYLALAYDGPLPGAVKNLNDMLHAHTGPLEQCKAFVATSETPPRQTLRLGNRHYPHMKLMLEPAPDGSRYLFKCDTHDRHICVSSQSPDYPAFCKLMKENQQLASSIESAWGEFGLPTFKSYLQEDLLRRQARVASP